MFPGHEFCIFLKFLTIWNWNTEAEPQRKGWFEPLKSSPVRVFNENFMEEIEPKKNIE